MSHGEPTPNAANPTADHCDAETLAARLASVERELANAQKQAALGELVGTTTHEFNNVLMTVLNYAKLGLRHKDDKTRDKALTKILAAAERAEKICNSVLGMARNRKEEFAPIDLSQLMEQSLVLLEREMQKYRVHVVREFAEVPPVRAIGNQIQQVLLNLMTNARQAMPEGGTLLLKLSYDEQADLVDLVVRDTGSGIPKEQLGRIFDRYFSTKEGPDETGKGGAGLGLSACREIIEAHQGRVRVESRVGKGTAFTIRIPSFKQAANTGANAPITSLGVPSALPVSNLPSTT